MAAQRIIETDLGSWEESRTALHRGLFSAREAADYLDQAHRLWDVLQHRDPGNVRFGMRGSLEGEWVLDRIDPVADVSPFFRALGLDTRLTSLAREYLGGEVLLMKEKLIYKPPGAPGYGGHRDGAYFCDAGPEENEMLTVALAFDRATVQNGALKLYPQSRSKALESPPGEPRDITESALDREPVFQPELDPGDAIFFDCSVPHNSAPNHSEQARCCYFITYALATYPGARQKFYDRYCRELATIRQEKLGDGTCFVSDAAGQTHSIDPDLPLDRQLGPGFFDLD